MRNILIRQNFILRCIPAPYLRHVYIGNSFSIKARLYSLSDARLVIQRFGGKCGYADMRICGYTDIRICGCADIRICGYADMQIYGYADMRICGYTDMRIYGYTDIKLTDCKMYCISLICN